MEAHCLGGDRLSDMIADKDRMRFDRLLDELTDYARSNDRGNCFPKNAWTRESTRNFLHFHINQGTLFIVRLGGEIVGLTCWWRWNLSEIPELSDDEILQNPPPHRKDGDLLYISDVVATTPKAMRLMCREMVRRNPDYNEIEIWSTRRNKSTGEVRRVKYNGRLFDLIKA